MLAHSLFKQSEVEGKPTDIRILMAKSKGHDWHNFPWHFKYGTLLVPQEVFVELSPEQLARIPEKHRPEPGKKFTRTRIVEENLRLRSLTEAQRYFKVFPNSFKKPT